MEPIPPILNRSDIPSRYLRPYTQWVFKNLPVTTTHLWSRRQTPPVIEAVAYYLRKADQQCFITYREKGEVRQRGDTTQSNHLNIFLPMGTPYSQTKKEEYIANLKIRLFEVTVQIGAALGIFGCEPLPNGPMPLYRQRIGKLWMEQADDLLLAWKKAKQEDA